ncbi:uncharacterized protein [Henckelia pumila]|uniref:uncharacterized protein n=1 Tax=Henckelia pumila TaxID=405737 RepID=UPI003C6E06B3
MVLDLMNVKGLTITHVKSHLQVKMYRSIKQEHMMQEAEATKNKKVRPPTPPQPNIDHVRTSGNSNHYKYQGPVATYHEFWPSCEETVTRFVPGLIRPTTTRPVILALEKLPIKRDELTEQRPHFSSFAREIQLGCYDQKSNIAPVLSKDYFRNNPPFQEKLQVLQDVKSSTGYRYPRSIVEDQECEFKRGRMESDQRRSLQASTSIDVNHDLISLELTLG